MNVNTVIKPGSKYKNQKNEIVLVEKSCNEHLSILPESLWQSPNGSLYKCINDEFVCIYVHSAKFRGWINKVAIKNIHQMGSVCIADQAFRYMATGKLSSWEHITLDISENRIVKHFPEALLNHGLVYGLTEIYIRVYEH